ncbi:hypothetical protein HNQ91_000676 [Filimonas zeae]|uniref:Uncharacterized protein n=1 Tax=Filimonas zeae TaxID=1737353 RepID=A0A917IQE2_9BACT|nr:hypothetical protein [Filimonas zeae]MDR6337654.1 hypothetical protein [Filimonas zeae]GGH59650.1 hypothetical protein GCM10011379_06660 [Filimonas zeae]
MLQVSIPRYTLKTDSVNNNALEYIYQQVREHRTIQFYPASDITRKSAEAGCFPEFIHPMQWENTFEIAIIYKLSEDSCERVRLHGILIGTSFPKEVSIPMTSLSLTQALSLADYLSTYFSFQEMVAKRKKYSLAKAKKKDMAVLAEFAAEYSDRILNIYTYTKEVVIVKYHPEGQKKKAKMFMVMTDWADPVCSTLAEAEEKAFEHFSDVLVRLQII